MRDCARTTAESLMRNYGISSEPDVMVSEISFSSTIRFDVLSLPRSNNSVFIEYTFLKNGAKAFAILYYIKIIINHFTGILEEIFLACMYVNSDNRVSCIVCFQQVH